MKHVRPHIQLSIENLVRNDPTHREICESHELKGCRCSGATDHQVLSHSYEKGPRDTLCRDAVPYNILCFKDDDQCVANQRKVIIRA